MESEVERGGGRKKVGILYYREGGGWFYDKMSSKEFKTIFSILLCWWSICQRVLK